MFRHFTARIVKGGMGGKGGEGGGLPPRQFILLFQLSNEQSVLLRITLWRRPRFVLFGLRFSMLGLLILIVGRDVVIRNLSFDCHRWIQFDFLEVSVDKDLRRPILLSYMYSFLI
jgi:hypothetical protein